MQAGARYTNALGGLLVAEASEKDQLHDFSLPRIQGSKPRESFVQKNQVRGGLRRDHRKWVRSCQGMSAPSIRTQASCTRAVVRRVCSGRSESIWRCAMARSRSYKSVIRRSKAWPLPARKSRRSSVSPCSSRGAGSIASLFSLDYAKKISGRCETPQPAAAL